MAEKRKSHLVSERVSELPHSIFARLANLVGKGVISLGPGEPDFATPKHICNAAKKALDEGYTHYPPTTGYPDLLEALGKKLKAKNGIRADDPQTQICVTCGSTESLLLSMFTAVDPTEAVLVPDPGYMAYGPMIEMVDAEPVTYELHDDDGFQIDTDAMKKRIKPKTVGIILNNPSNPTGTVLKRSVLEEIADIAVDNNLMIISDEAYEDFTFGGAEHTSIGSFNGMEDYVVTNFSFSKSYAMAGWRVGYAVGPSSFIETMSKDHLYTSIASPALSQRAAIAAVTGPHACVEGMAREYERRRDFMLKRLNEISCLEVKVKPEGAFYVFPRIHSFGKMNSEQFSLWLLKEAKVVTIPGSEFGQMGEGFLRLSYATDMKSIASAMDRLEKLLGKK
ncbi:Aromatic-amino-acid aminotransferase 2 [uncultured archaeon]|nr:Aromatic-amino-acid aminotransferase 2 [uncultured archaeon]